MPARSGVPQLILNFSFILFINQISTFMKKNLFLAGALALFAVVGVSAQNWSRTLATGTTGEQITHDVNGTSVTQYRAETALIQNAGATGVRYTVMQTGALNQLKRVGPCFAIGEIFVLDAAGDTIDYTVTSNAGHNELTGGTDGAGLPAVNDGNLNNFFHTVWNDSYAIDEYHYLELTFEKSVDAFQLVWYTRPNQHQNRPLVIGLTNPGVTFTEDMLFAEYEFELGEQVTKDADIADGGAFTFFVEGPAEFGDTQGNGNIFVSLSGYETGANTEASPHTIVQLIPNGKGGFVLYQPVSATYYGSADKWTDAYNGKNGWQRATDDATRLGQFEITATGNGDFEITTYATRQYADGAWVDYEEPLKLWVGYDMRGNLKIFDEDHKEALEQEDYTQGFGLPVDFGFDIYRANVNKEMVPDKTVAEMCDEVLTSTIKLAEEKQEEYADVVNEGYDYEGAADVLAEAIDAANTAKADADLASAFEAKAAIENAIAMLVAQKANYYEELYSSVKDEVEANLADFPYTQDETGMYTQASMDILAQVEVLYGNAMNYEENTYSQIEAMYAQIESLLEQLDGTKLAFTEFPAIVSDIPADNFPYEELPNNAVWKNNVNLVSAVEGIRLTFLERHRGNANDPGNFPMIAIGELKVYDGEGNEVTLTEENFVANHTETQEGFESTVARLVDGVWGQGDGVTTDKAAGSYYHSPWSGSEPQEYICIDVTFPAPMSAFAVELYSRDKSTSNGAVSLFPKKIAITEVGVGYDPLLFAENPYNVRVGEQVTDLAQLETGLYIVKGLLNTKSVNVLDEETGNIVKSEPNGEAKFYAGTSRFHSNEAAVRANCVYRIVKNDDGTYTFVSLSAAKYWPTLAEDENAKFVSATASKSKAAKIKAVASAATEGAFVLYEEQAGRVTKDSIDTDADGVNDTERVVETPYMVYMDWYSGLAARAVTDPQPKDTEGVLDAKGDSLCFNKANGEGEWQIYKVTMDNPDYYWLENMLGIVSGLGLEVGPDPGCVASLGELEDAYTKAQAVVADSAFAEAPAAAAALAETIGLAETLEKNPMVPGYYRIQSAVAEFFTQQGHTKSIYVSEDGMTLGWKKTETDNIAFYFDFRPSSENPDSQIADLVVAGTITEEEAAQAYTIRAVGTTVSYSEFYIGESDAQSQEIPLADGWPSDYLVLPATGSNFNLANPTNKGSFCLHANGHGSGAGQGSNLVYWSAGAGASQWRLIKVDYVPQSIEDLVAEGDEVVSVAYYTVGGASSSAPAKGVNIVKIVYANGVVETKKVLVK